QKLDNGKVRQRVDQQRGVCDWLQNCQALFKQRHCPVVIALPEEEQPLLGDCLPQDPEPCSILRPAAESLHDRLKLFNTLLQPAADVAQQGEASHSTTKPRQLVTLDGPGPGSMDIVGLPGQFAEDLRLLAALERVLAVSQQSQVVVGMLVANRVSL